MRFVAHVELAAAAKMRIVVSAGSVAICPACGIEKGAHRVGQWVLWLQSYASGSVAPAVHISSALICRGFV